MNPEHSARFMQAEAVRVKTHSEPAYHKGIIQSTANGIKIIYFQNQRQDDIRRVQIPQELVAKNEFSLGNYDGQLQINYRFQKGIGFESFEVKNPGKHEYALMQLISTYANKQE